MKYLAILCGTIDDIPLGLFDSHFAASEYAREAYERDSYSDETKRVLKLMNRDTSNIVAYAVAEFDDTGDMTDYTAYGD